MSAEVQHLYLGMFSHSGARLLAKLEVARDVLHLAEGVQVAHVLQLLLIPILGLGAKLGVDVHAVQLVQVQEAAQRLLPGEVHVRLLLDARIQVLLLHGARARVAPVVITDLGGETKG